MRRDEVRDLVVARLVDFQAVTDGILDPHEHLRSLEFLLDARLAPIERAVRQAQERVAPHVALRNRAYLFLRIVNRLVFEVAELSPQGSPMFGGFRVPEQNGMLRSAWPLVYGDEGLELLVVKQPSYMGAEFQAVDEFRYCRSIYPRRTSFW